MIQHFVAVALIAAQASTTTAPPRCLTRQQAGDIAATVTPIMLGALAERCRPHVGPTAFLNTRAEAMLTRLREAAAPRRASAFAAFAAMNRPPTAEERQAAEAAAEATEGSTDQLDESHDHGDQAEEQADESVETEAQDSPFPFDMSANPEAVEGIATIMLGVALAGMDNRACADADVVMESLAPLSPDNIARLAGATLGMVGTFKPDMPNNPLCPE